MTDAVLDHSRQSMEQGSKSFAAAARLFPAAIRDDAWMLYSWCRHCDDEIDGQVLGHGGDAAQMARFRVRQQPELVVAFGQRLAERLQARMPRGEEQRQDAHAQAGGDALADRVHAVELEPRRQLRNIPSAWNRG